MTPEQVELVRSTWGRIALSSDVLAERFYGRLFLLDPALRQMFPKDLQSQRHALMEFLNVVVNGLPCIDSLVLEIEDLGLRHLEYGVKPEHYGLVRTALFGALADRLGTRFTPDVAAAWAETYDQLARIMQEAAYSPAGEWRWQKSF